MLWLHYVECFFGGAFLANAIPHLIAGISGKRLQTPFASPPFRGLSSPFVNVAWALFNIAAAYLLLAHLGALNIGSFSDVGVCFAGFGAMAFQCARAFGHLRKESDAK